MNEVTDEVDIGATAGSDNREASSLTRNCGHRWMKRKPDKLPYLCSVMKEVTDEDVVGVTAAGDNKDVANLTKQLRQLTDEEKARLDKDSATLSEFKQRKLELEAQKNWDLFYKRNTTKFFKDRHWTKREFRELANKKDGERLTLFEVGCGVGNFLFPLLQESQGDLVIYACDFSKRAVQFVQDNTLYNADICTAFHCDITETPVADSVPPDRVDVATMIFVLSAIHPDKMVAAAKNVLQVLRPGGCLLVRDYGMHDYAMLRFAPGHKIMENFYTRQDGTRAYYFTIEKLSEVFLSAGYEVESCDYVQRQTVNKKEGLSVPRIFVQGKFVKPLTTDTVTTDLGPHS